MKRVICAMAVVLCVAGCRGNGPGEADVLNVVAKLPAGLPVPALEWKTISSSVDRKTGTMNLLTGNDAAVRGASTGSYGDGVVLALTTWAQRDDPHWFGARIPGGFVSLETVTVSLGTDGKTTAVYRRFTGSPAREVAGAGDAESRKMEILGMRASQLP